MRLAWWGFIVIGVVLLGVGAFATSTSQSSMNYIKSHCKPVACGGLGPGNAQPRFFFTAASKVSLQDAELAWIAGIAIAALGLVGIAYGVFSQLKEEPTVTPASA